MEFWQPSSEFRRSWVDPCCVTNSTTGVRIGRHMDDFIKTGSPKAVQAVMEYLERVAQLKITGVLDPVWQTGTILGLIHHESTGWLHDSDRHRDFAGRTARLELGTLQTVETAWRLPGPMILHRCDPSELLYCSAHRGDFAFTLNQLCRRVQSPTVSDMQALRKLARYIKGILHYKLNIRPRHNTDLKIEAYTDADWARPDTASQVSFSCLMVSMSLLGHGHRKRLQLPAENQSSML